MKTVTIEQAMELENVVFIDVRSEKEYADGTIYGAVSVPIFNNEERAEVGYVYKNIGKKEAKERGLEIASGKLVSIYRKLKPFVKERKKIVIFCWRGGMRSASVTKVMEMLDLNVCQLQGGYKAYRRMVLTEFENWQQKKPFIVLHGGTGVGKTDLLDELTKRNLPVLDLEGMANHRGSVFGAVGLGEQPPQKQFEGCLYDKINQLKNDSIFVEAESSKIGKVILPPFVKNGIRKGIVVWVICDKEMRVNRLIKEYIECDPKKYTKEMLSALAMIKQYLKKEIYIEIQSCLENHDFESAARLLLDEYYDPLYSKWKETYKGFSYTVDTSDFEQGVEQLVEIYNEVADKEY